MSNSCTTQIPLRLLLVAPDPESLDLMQTLLNAAVRLVPVSVDTHPTWARTEMVRRARAKADDLVILDWQVAESDTPDVVRELLSVNPNLRIIVLLPLTMRQYRQCLWDAGVCSSIPTENLDAEWLSSALCLITRAMQREQRARLQIAA
jgi:DNA-binding NarL/FixJ family response regulator